MFELSTKIKQWIDASEDYGISRFFNDNHTNPNMKVKMIIVENIVYPFSVRIGNIEAGEELTHNYGQGENDW